MLSAKYIVCQDINPLANHPIYGDGRKTWLQRFNPIVFTLITSF